MNTSDTLNMAADLIERDGWTQGAPGWDAAEGSSPALCIEGGIAAAMGIHIDVGDDPACGPAGIQVLWACPAYNAVADYLGCGLSGGTYLENYNCRSVWRWNDVPDRTAAEVVEVLRATAVIEASREKAEALAHV